MSDWFRLIQRIHEGFRIYELVVRSQTPETEEVMGQKGWNHRKIHWKTMGKTIGKWWFNGILMGNNVLLVKIEGPVWYTIYHHLPVAKGINKALYSSTDQWEKDIYGWNPMDFPIFFMGKSMVSA